MDRERFSGWVYVNGYCYFNLIRFHSLGLGEMEILRFRLSAPVGENEGKWRESGVKVESTE